MQEPVLYRDEVWTGGEYQLASHLLSEGMIREGLSIIRGIHDRYDGKRHNPWNEVECGDHYARALASWKRLSVSAPGALRRSAASWSSSSVRTRPTVARRSGSPAT